jgi:hypothetical protein
MMSFLSRSKAAPAQKGKRANGTPRNNVNEAQKKLAIALNNIAAQHVNKYANAIRASAKAEANAARATAVAVAAPTQTNVNRAVNAVNKANAAQQTVSNTERAAFISLIGLQGGNLNTNGKLNMNKVRANVRFSNSPNITAAIEKRLAGNRGNNLT